MVGHRKEASLPAERRRSTTLGQAVSHKTVSMLSTSFLASWRFLFSPDGLTPESYHLLSVRLNEAINDAWSRLSAGGRASAGMPAGLVDRGSEVGRTRLSRALVTADMRASGSRSRPRGNYNGSDADPSPWGMPTVMSEEAREVPAFACCSVGIGRWFWVAWESEAEARALSPALASGL